MEHESDDTKTVYEVSLEIALEPVSVQSSRDKRLCFERSVRESLRAHNYYIVDDVQLTIEWYVHEQARYESDRKADLDNILKPLCDALSGPEGLLVDDTLIQSMYCGWIDHTLATDVIRLRIRSVKSESITEISLSRNSLVFVEVDRHLFLPLSEEWPIGARRVSLQSILNCIPARNRIREATGSYYSGQYVMPLQRLFHRSRITRFRLFTLEEYWARLGPAT